MKNKLLLITTTLAVMINLVGCGTNQQSNTIKNKVENTTEQTKNDLVKIPKDLKGEMGTGTFYVSTPSGTSENGKTPIIYITKDTKLQQIGVTTKDFSGKNLSYIFIDSIYNSKKQLSDTSENIDLKGEALKLGKHRVDVIQFNNNKTTDKVITHKIAYYEVKSK